MPAETKISVVSVVVLGAFAPPTFHPSWFARNNLLASAEADAAVIEIVHTDVAIFKTEWLVVNAAQDKFSVTCTRDDSIPLLADLVIGVFQILSQSPVRAFGINREIHFQMGSVEEWHEIGHRYAPKECWKGILESPGMLAVHMQGAREDGRPGKINILIQPSDRVSHGAFVRVNDHYDLASNTLAEEGLKDIRSLWSSSLERSLNMATKLVTL
ncbi:MAG: hypothetical protein V4773_14380 [Verrucomicrobiota bacterium]